MVDQVKMIRAKVVKVEIFLLSSRQRKVSSKLTIKLQGLEVLSLRQKEGQHKRGLLGNNRLRRS